MTEVSARNAPAEPLICEEVIGEEGIREEAPLLRVELSVDYPTKPGVLRNVAFSIAHGEILGLVGLSGAGKSTIAQAILQTLDRKGAVVRGEVAFDGENLLTASRSRRRAIRGRKIALIPQSPIAALNPSLTLKSQFEEAWNAHSKVPFRQILPRVFDLLRSVSLPDSAAFLRSYPSSLSVGLAQRVLIALAMLHGPVLAIGDEPTSALDVITQAEVLKLFRALSEKSGMGMLYISHDLLSVAHLCHRVAVLYQGSLVEIDATNRIFSNPQHSYTKQLVDSIPKLALMRESVN